MSDPEQQAVATEPDVTPDVEKSRLLIKILDKPGGTMAHYVYFIPDPDQSPAPVATMDPAITVEQLLEVSVIIHFTIVSSGPCMLVCPPPPPPGISGTFEFNVPD